MRRRSAIIATVLGLALGALAGLSAFFAWPMLVTSQALTPPEPSEIRRDPLAVPDRRVGRRQGVSL
jgi:hypothetical protein